MRTIKFTTLHGVALSGFVQNEIKIGRKTVSVVHALSKVYAVVDGYSLVEAETGTTLEELRDMIIREI